ncbi:MAG: polyprenyl synthetase family protein [bacterium]|jgi:octaprenyl-diphosphate synthase|nr:polyprenyl synthetase family protein [bacterium]
MIRLDQVQELVQPELAEFRRRYDEWIKTGKTPIVDQVIRFLTPRRGKLLRPTLTYLSARLLGESNERTHFAAVVVELLHNATLLHDDVVDNSDKRRGMPSLNAIFGNKVSVLFGDYLLASSLLAMLECGDARVFEVLARTARRLAKGELDQAARSKNLDMDEETYYRMVANKTGALVAASCVLGGLSNEAGEEQTAALRAFGEALGVAFQIQDDLLDYTGKEALIGKPVGGDLKERKITLPLIHAFSRSEASEVREMKRLVARPRLGDLKRVVRFAVERGGVDYARGQALTYSRQALAALALFPESPVKARLHDFSVFAVERSH